MNTAIPRNNNDGVYDSYTQAQADGISLRDGHQIRIKSPQTSAAVVTEITPYPIAGTTPQLYIKPDTVGSGATEQWVTDRFFRRFGSVSLMKADTEMLPGYKCTTGNTVWLIQTQTSPVQLSSGLYAVPLNDLYPVDFGADNTAVSDSSSARDECFDVALSLSRVIAGVTKRGWSVRFDDGYYRFESRYVNESDLTNQDVSLSIIGANENSTFMISQSADGWFKWVKSNYGQFFTMSNITVLDGYSTFSGQTRVSGGNAVELVQATSGDRKHRHQRFSNVVIGSLDPITAEDHFSKGISITGGGRALIKNYHFYGVRGADRPDSWQSISALDIYDNYAPTVKDTKTWSSDYGIRYVATNDPGAEAGTFRNINVDANRGFTCEAPSTNGEPGLYMDDVSTNCGTYGYMIKNRKFVKIVNSLMYNETTSGNYFDIVLDNVKDSDLDNITFTFPSNPDRTGVRLLGTSGTGCEDVRIKSCNFLNAGTAVSSGATGVSGVSIINPKYGPDITTQVANNGNADAFTSFELSGNGSPEGVYRAPQGSTYKRHDGGTSTSFYVKETPFSSSGWAAK